MGTGWQERGQELCPALDRAILTAAWAETWCPVEAAPPMACFTLAFSWERESLPRFLVLVSPGSRDVPLRTSCVQRVWSAHSPAH